MEVSDLLLDKKFQEFVVNASIPFPVILKQAGLGSYDYSGKCFCCFHENYQTPAAKLFKDKRGDTMFCFSEQKVYHPVDVVKKGLLKIPVETLFQRLWAQFSEERKEKLVGLYGKPIDYVPQAWRDNKDILDKFKLGEVTFAQHLIHIRDSLD